MLPRRIPTHSELRYILAVLCLVTDNNDKIQLDEMFAINIASMKGTLAYVLGLDDQIPGPGFESVLNGYIDMLHRAGVPVPECPSV